jgi:hypothetical protein
MMKNSKLGWVTTKLWPMRHRRFEEMAVLAVSGQLGGPQMCELNEHIGMCDSCRGYLESITQTSLRAAPSLAEGSGPARGIAPPEGMRERFLARLAGESPDSKGRVLGHASPVLVRRVISLPLEPRPVEREAEQKASAIASVAPSPAWRVVAAVVLGAVIGAAGYYLGQRRGVHVPTQAAQVVQSTQSPETDTPSVNLDDVNPLKHEKSQLSAEVADMEGKLARSVAEEESLRSELRVAKERLSTLETQAQNGSQRFSAVRGASEDQVSALQAQVGILTQRLGESEVRLDLEKQSTEELSAKLEATTADLERERDLQSAKNQMGDLVAARNLHIVDVYDADTTGKRQRSFGRVFYVEGKSLVFYAYDLDGPGQHQANVVFHVWGGKAGGKELTHSLGILAKDADSDSRWAMTFDDPGVLGQINSVFVTAEPANKRADEPRGKKILYAYFGSAPNHP